MTMSPSPFIDEERHTLASYLALYRAGKIGPLQYADARVPVVPCRYCGRSRPDDGAACQFCGAYKRRTCPYPSASDTSSPIAPPETVGMSGKRTHNKPRKAINPRRCKKHD